MYKDPVLRVMADLKEYADAKAMEAEEWKKRCQTSEAKVAELEYQLSQRELENAR